jgi:phospholipid/cholesterol/gamma-HCH transport system permease protein
MIACLLVLPLMYVLSLATSFFASWVVQRFQIGLVSNGVYFSYFWRFTNLTDFGYSVIKAVIFAFLVICVGVYYGYHVKGGAVGIGRAVAKTMAISLVMIVVVNALLTQIFWGTNPNLPIPS